MDNSLTERESKTLEAIRNTDLSAQRRLPVLFVVAGISLFVLATVFGIAMKETFIGVTNGAWAFLLCLIMSKGRSGYNHLYSVIKKIG
ncbi:hypothetical protein DTL42_01960 [Bremerella cremea]|uniref:Uncharacterized protein n=1 Tax=Bremerella cremea TaxID=1031537 RepID=A0A368KXU6_9BACT|nr:hypothetical protein DTL42_01960 [Bremerella cremea]